MEGSRGAGKRIKLTTDAANWIPVAGVVENPAQSAFPSAVHLLAYVLLNLGSVVSTLSYE